MTEMIIQDDIKSEDKLSVQLKNLIQQAVDNEYQYFEDCSQLHT